MSDPSVLKRHLAVNLFGTYAVTQAFLPLLAHSGGCVVNNLSVNALAPKGIRVHAVLTGPVATDMTAGLDIPKSSPESTAQGIFDGLQNDDDEIFPDALSQPLAQAWRSGVAKVLESQYAALLEAAGSPANRSRERTLISPT